MASKRVIQTEKMDSLDFEGPALHEVLRDLEKVNRFLLNHYHIRQAFAKLITPAQPGKISVTDIGCGGGDHLRNLARHCRKNGIQAEFLGLDHNPNVLEFAKSQSVAFPEIKFQQFDATHGIDQIKTCDIIISSHFMYHLADEDFIKALNILPSKSKIGVIISELQRNKLAATLFPVLAVLLNLTKISRQDGKAALRSAFRRNELRGISGQSTETWTLLSKIPFRLLLIFRSI